MAKLGLCGPALRLPITPLTPSGQAVVEQAMRDAGLL
jgi:4-hydroxy-tetrahydrodipicolinate synthase